VVGKIVVEGTAGARQLVFGGLFAFVGREGVRACIGVTPESNFVATGLAASVRASVSAGDRAGGGVPVFDGDP
jgi:hypothetical protein